MGSISLSPIPANTKDGNYVNVCEGVRRGVLRSPPDAEGATQVTELATYMSSWLPNHDSCRYADARVGCIAYPHGYEPPLPLHAHDIKSRTSRQVFGWFWM